MARILIADDDELIAELASQVLIDAGHACGWVTSGEDCWTLLKGRRPDLLLLDQDMPGISGVNLLRRIRQSQAHYDLPVIMFTAMNGAEDETRAIYAGAQDYIRKPFEPRGLKNRVQRVLSRRLGQPQHTTLKTYLAQSSGQIAEPAQPKRRLV